MEPTDIRKMMPNAGHRLDAHIPYIVPALEKGEITTPRRIAAFFAEVAHESGEYRYMEEIADGSAYDQRTDLGNTPELDGDGQWFKGHGPMGVTGHDNHLACGQYLGIDLIKNPKLITLPEYATASAVWFWTIGNGKTNLNLLADVDWFKTITLIINGGYNGWVDRLNYYTRNRQLLDLPPYVEITEASRIADFQRSHGLMADGIVGKRTLATLKAAA